MENEELRISLVQYDIQWEERSKNLLYIDSTVSSLGGKTDLVVLPEMCTSGFTFVDNMAEAMDGESITWLKGLARQNDVAICGSFLCAEDGKLYNRAFFVTPTDIYTYDKRHLFRIGLEGERITAGTHRTIINYKGFNICPLICYDLRFPVWARNVNNEYDILIYVANWPEARKEVWNTLLKARAIENMCYVCGVNRIGKDGHGLNHAGESVMLNPRGQKIISIDENKEDTQTVIVYKETLIKDRTHFPVWKDADRFEIKD